MGLKTPQLPPLPQTPEGYGAIIAGHRQQHIGPGRFIGLGEKSQSGHCAGVAGQDPYLLTGGQIPNLCGTAGTAGRQPVSVAADGDGIHGFDMAGTDAADGLAEGEPIDRTTPVEGGGAPVGPGDRFFRFFGGGFFGGLAGSEGDRYGEDQTGGCTSPWRITTPLFAMMRGRQPFLTTGPDGVRPERDGQGDHEEHRKKMSGYGRDHMGLSCPVGMIRKNGEVCFPLFRIRGLQWQPA